jgi:regulatory protein
MKKIDFSSAKIKIVKYCAYQERAHYEVEQKLYSYGLYTDKVQELLAWLITENYLNEERFAIAYAGGKFRIKKWGRIKIKQNLALKKVSGYSIEKALSQIEDDTYLRTLKNLIRAKEKTTKADNTYELRNKIARSVISKGFEPEKVWELVKTIIP